MMVEGLARSGAPGCEALAGELAGSWLASVWATYKGGCAAHEYCPVTYMPQK